MVKFAKIARRAHGRDLPQKEGLFSSRRKDPETVVDRGGLTVFEREVSLVV